ncbi:MAG TPA: guanitoxin biosynthesis PLP-dependent transaminase GntE [Anaerolineae bacterium]|mgnify:CR=1 FL=1|nr:guanitoxin biosynthesis PLP-dependent transaminase GntE [Anaerolineae bacterium]
MKRDTAHQLYERARKVLVQGVSSNLRYDGDNTPVIARGKGCKVWDVDGNEFVDYRLGWGPIILGHADDRVDNAVAQAIRNGITFAATTDLEVSAAEKIVNMVPGLEVLRFSNTGTEVTMHALRVARGYTGRECYIKFEGQYHGMHDYSMFSSAGAPLEALGGRRNPIPAQSSSGVPEGIRNYVITVPFNDFELVERTVDDHYGDIAAMFIEPCLGNFAGLEPKEGYLEHLRKLCDEYGIVMVFDEVKTGFRLANAGARETYGVIPDLSTYAKALGNGYPVAAFGGKREIMEVLATGVSHGGTYNGNGVAMAAANAVLDILASEPVLEQVAQRGQRLQQGIHEILTEANIPHQITGHPCMPGFLITEQEVKEFRDLVYHDGEFYEEIMRQLYERGIWPEIDAQEPWFLCAAHNDQIIDETLNRFVDAVKIAKEVYYG